MDLENYYKLNFALMQYHKYSLTEIENLMPWERDVYVALLKQDCTKKEVVNFLEQMNSAQFKEIESFFETMPKLSHTVDLVNPKTKKKSTVVLEGLSSFFA